MAYQNISTIMNRIDKLFQDRKQDVLSVYFCAGTPSVEGTADVVRALAGNGVQMVEIGIPFSDPVADGPVVQAAAENASGGIVGSLFVQLLEEASGDADKAVRRLKTLLYGPSAFPDGYML